MEIAQLLLSIFWSIISFIHKRIFWRNHEIIYINDNKKVTDEAEIYHNFNVAHHKLIHIHSNGLKNSHPNLHLLLMKINLRSIVRNTKSQPNIYYCGFVSVPFAIYDGYRISDNHIIILCDKKKDKNDIYSLKFNRKRLKHYDYEISGDSEINLVIESSCHVVESLIKNENKTYNLNISKAPDKIDANYLNEMYYRTLDFMDASSKNGVKKVNIFCSSRQIVSFVIGTAIQSRHPNVICYEFEGDEYTWGLNLKTGKIIK